MPNDTFRKSSDWQYDALSEKVRPEIDRRYETGHVQVEGNRQWHSFSGHERNQLFMNDRGRSFENQSALSGLDNIADGRAFAVCDFDRDGWQDIVLVNANYPLLNLYKNEQSKTTSKDDGNYIAVRLVGGNQSSKPSTTFSNRDAIGAEIRLALTDQTLHRELRCGEGFAAQNSNTIVIGIGKNKAAKSLSIHWPSGRDSNIGSIAAGSLVTVFENADRATGDRHRVVPYATKPIEFARSKSVTRSTIQLPAYSESKTEFRLITTMATWCDACKKHLPQLAHIRDYFPDNQLDMIGVPADPIDTEAELANYVSEHSPAYRLVIVDSKELSSIQNAILKTLRTDVLPSTILTDADGNVLQTFEDVPTASAIAKLMEK